jgi:hypothetical protein
VSAPHRALPAAAERADAGSALVEFVGLAALLLVPICYLVLIAGSVERTAFAAASAARAAGRAYVTAGSDALGRERAALAAQLALSDAGVPTTPGELSIACGSCAYTPGSYVTVTIHVDVPMPGLAAAFCTGQRCLASIPVTAHHVERIDCFVAGMGAVAC